MRDIMQPHLALPLIHIQCFVNLVEENVPILAVLWHEDSAEADAELAGFHIERELFGELRLNLACQIAGGFLGDIGQEDHEFVTTIAGNKAGVGQSFDEHIRKGGQNIIAGLMSKAVIYLLEIIQIHNEQCSFNGIRQQKRLQLLLNATAIGQTCESIGLGNKGHLRKLFPLLGDIG